MLGLLVLGVLGIVALAIFGVFAAVIPLVCWVLFLPFKLLGLVFRGFAFLLLLPFILLAVLVGTLVFGAGLLVFFIPALPVIGIALLVWWLMRRHPHATAPL